MKILVTGAAGFIGFHLTKRLLDDGHFVVGIDVINDYYDVALKQARLAQISAHNQFAFVQIDLADRQAMEALFAEGQFECVVNLAAQAGVRYSLENPYAYIDANPGNQALADWLDVALVKFDEVYSPNRPGFLEGYAQLKDAIKPWGS